MAHNTAKASLGWLRNLLSAPAERNTALMPPSDKSVFDTQQVQTCCLGSSATGRSVLEAVLTHGPELMEDIESAHDRRDLDSLLSHVHDLRGLAQILGAYSPAQACLRLELLYEGSSQENQDKLLCCLNDHIVSLFDSIYAYLHAWAA